MKYRVRSEIGPLIEAAVVGPLLHRIAVQVPGAGWWTSMCPMLPVPCGSVYAANAPDGSSRLARTYFEPSPATLASRSIRSVPAGTVKVFST